MRSKRNSAQSRNFVFWKKCVALIISLFVIVGAVVLALVNNALDQINYIYDGESGKNNPNGIGNAAIIDLSEHAEQLHDFDAQLENLVVKNSSQIQDTDWQHDLFVLDLGDKEKTNNNVLLAIFSQNSVNHQQVLQFVSPHIYVNLAGLANNPLGQSWLYGGASALRDTLSRNLGINISNTFLLKAGKLVDLIDSINGIALKIDDNALAMLEKNNVTFENLLNSNNKSTHKTMNFADYKKTSIANGVLAVAYASLGIATDNDKLVPEVFLQQISKEFSDLNVTGRWKFIKRLLNCITTDASRFSIVKTIFKAFVSTKQVVCAKLPAASANEPLVVGNVIISNIGINDLRKEFFANLQARTSEESEENETIFTTSTDK